MLGRKLSGITFSLSSVGGVGRAFRLAVGIMERDLLMTGGGWGLCSIRSWLSACRRRVVLLMVQFPLLGGGEVAGLMVSRNFACNSREHISNYAI